MLELFISAMMLGFLFNAAPGAIFTESLRRGLQGGFKSALYVQFGSLVGDLTWAILGLGGAAVLFEITAIKIPFSKVMILFFITLPLPIWAVAPDIVIILFCKGAGVCCA